MARPISPGNGRAIIALEVSRSRRTVSTLPDALYFKRTVLGLKRTRPAPSSDQLCRARRQRASHSLRFDPAPRPYSGFACRPEVPDRLLFEPLDRQLEGQPAVPQGPGW